MIQLTISQKIDFSSKLNFHFADVDAKIAQNHGVKTVLDIQEAESTLTEPWPPPP